MSEEYDPSRVIEFRYSLPDTAKDETTTQLCIKHGTAHLDVDFVDDEAGNKDMSRLIMSYPKIITHVRKEATISREVNDLDQDLLDLLGEDDS